MDVSPSSSLNGTCALIQEVGQEAAHDSLVGDDEDVALTLQLHDDGLQPLHQVLIRLWGEMGQAGRRRGTSWQPSQWLSPELRGHCSFPSQKFTSPANIPQPWHLLRIFRLFKSNIQTKKTTSQEKEI